MYKVIRTNRQALPLMGNGADTIAEASTFEKACKLLTFADKNHGKYKYKVVKTATAVLIAVTLTACNSPCDNYPTHNGEQDYCTHASNQTTAMDYLDNGAQPAPSKEWVTLENAKKLLAFRKEYL